MSRPIAFLGEPRWAMFSLIISDIWASTPLMIVLFLAGLQAIPLELYDAAAVDGANRWQRFILVTIAQLRPIAFVAITMRTVFIIRGLGLVFVLTGGGPADATQVYATYLYNTFLPWKDVGGGATLGILLVIVSVLIVFAVRLIVKPEKYRM